jgi:uncharacterized protein
MNTPISAAPASEPAGISRWRLAAVAQALETRRVVVLTGARQCGKTTLAKQFLQKPVPSDPKHGTIYRTLDDIAMQKAAKADPHGFVAHGDGLMVIDEVQRVPELLLAIKKDVDDNPRSGRFLLTGSADIQSLPTVRESLAGRVSNVRLRPFAAGEMAGLAPAFLSRATRQDWDGLGAGLAGGLPLPHLEGVMSGKDTVLQLAMRGGYPEVQRLKPAAARRWHQDYLAALMARDLRDIARISRKDSMAKLLEVLAAWSSKFIDISAIGAQLALARPTLEAYANALEALFLIERVRPWSKTDYDRVSKQDKLFMTDTGLIASLLRWQFDKVRIDADQSGKLVESYVFSQLAAQLEAQEDTHTLSHYRDREQREIDFIVETPQGITLGIEVKAGSAVGEGSFKHLAWFKERMLPQNAPFVGIVLYTGEHVLRFGVGMWAVPMHALWHG